MSHTPRLLLVVVLLLGMTLAGCLGGEEDPATTPTTDDGGPTAQPTDETGSIRGQVVTKTLEEVEGASVAAIDTEGAIAAKANTDKQGKFVLNGLAPGSYQVQVSALCCKPSAQIVDVTAGKITDVGLQVERLSHDDLQHPYMVEDSWNGFLSCGFSAGAPTAGQVGLNPCFADPNSDNVRYFNITKGIKSLVVALDWDPTGGILGDKLMFSIENREAEDDDTCAVECSYEYYGTVASPPIIVKIDNDDITSETWKWDQIEDSRELMFRVFPGGDANALYQQPFTVYWQAYHWDEAPDDVNPIPDR